VPTINLTLRELQQQLTKVSTAQAIALTAVHEPEMRQRGESQKGTLYLSTKVECPLLRFPFDSEWVRSPLIVKVGPFCRKGSPYCRKANQVCSWLGVATGVINPGARRSRQSAKSSSERGPTEIGNYTLANDSGEIGSGNGTAVVEFRHDSTFRQFRC
jgi:hypothetical protein